MACRSAALVRIPLIASPLDRLLLLDNAFPPLHGTEIPAFLELLGNHAAAVGGIVRGPGVAETHRIIGAAATTDFRVGIVEPPRPVAPADRTDLPP